MSIERAQVTEQELYDRIRSLQPGEQIFIPIDKEIGKQIRMLDYRKVGLQNLLTSYINDTHEEANLVHFQRLVDECAQLELAYREVKQDTTRALLGDRIYALVTMPELGNFGFRVDDRNNVLIIEIKKTSGHGHGHDHGQHGHVHGVDMGPKKFDFPTYKLNG